MKIKSIYPKSKEDNIFKKVELYIKEHYPHVKIQHVNIAKDLIFVKTHYGEIHLRKCLFT